jgi:hypothetical protein
MKKLILGCVLATAFYVSVQAQQLKTPPPSTTQKVTQEFGIGSIELTYSRPGVKNRKVFGDLVPFGKMWRTGANAATRIKFTNDVTVAGQPVKAGEYSIFTIPNETNWTLILNKDAGIKGVPGYKKEDDVLTATVASDQMVKLPPMKLKKGESLPVINVVETFTMQFANITNNTCELHIMWENTAVKIPIRAEYDEAVMKQIENTMSKDSRPYGQAAMYYMENGKDLNKALEWFNKAVEQRPDAYWVILNKAKCQQKMGNKADALETAKKALALANEDKNDDYVKMSEALIATLSK